MSTSKPRITVTLEPHAHEVLSRLSAAGGDSMSSLVAQFVTVALPSLERLVVVLERARTAPEEARAGLAAAIERAERQLLPALVNAQEMGDLFLLDLEAVPKAGATGGLAQPGRSPASAPVRSRKDPRLVTRGSGGAKQAGKGRARG